MNPPRFRHETESLAAVARKIWQDRVSLYPAAIAAGRIDETTAASNIRIAQAIAADWCRAWSREDLTIEAADATQPERIRTLAEAAQRARARIRAASGQDEAAERETYAELVETLLWWEHHPFGIAFLTRATDRLRADAAARQQAQVQAA